MENKLARFLRNTGPVRFFLPLSIVLIVFGIILLSMTPAKYGEVIGITTDLREYEEDGKTLFDQDFIYIVDGKEYTGTFYGLDDAFPPGAGIMVYYDVNNPENISNTKHTGLIALGVLAAGALALLYSIFGTVKAFKKSKELDDQIKSAAGTSEMPVITPVSKDQLTEYYVLHDGKTLNPGYIIEDKERNVIFEAPMTKNAMVGNRIFTFTNRLTGQTANHEVGHTTTVTMQDEFFSARSTFKFDGRDIWDILHERGVRISTDLHSKFPSVTYTVSLNGRFFATVETSGRFVHEEDAAQHKVNIPVGRYYYRCWTNENDLDLLFLTVFAISETEQAVVE